MATNTKMLLVATMSILLGLLSAPVNARIMNGYSIIYFDDNNKIIGQAYTDCYNVSKYAGNADSRNNNNIREEFGCGQPMVSCSESMFHENPGYNPSHDGYWSSNCQPAGFNYGSWITYFHSATGLTQNDYCTRSKIDGPFTGAPACGLPAPSTISGIGPYYNGFPPSN